MSYADKRRRIGLIVDHPTRDLPGMVLLGFHLARHDIETALIPMYQQGIDVPLLDLDALVMNFARPVNLPLARQYHALGTKLFVLDTEGGVLSSEGRASPEAIADYTATSGFSDLLSGYFFWGDRLRSAFDKAAVLPTDRLFLTGCPRFDFYTGILRECNPPKRRGHILVNTNFPMANPRFIDGRNDDRAALQELGFDASYVDALLSENRRIMAAMIALVDDLARDLPGNQIVLRPHPFERFETYESHFSGRSNVLVDGEGPVLDALNGARALVHLNCGTAVEALMSDVAPLTPDWINSDFMRRHVELPSRASHSVGSYAEMLDLLRSDVPGRDIDLPGLYRRVAQPYFHLNDGMAAQRVAAILARKVNRAVGNHRSMRIALNGSHLRPSLHQKIQALVGNLAGTAVVRDLRARSKASRKAKIFRARDVQPLLDRLGDLLGHSGSQAASATHPFTGLPLASVIMTPRAAC
ncbi:surface carbohydrate biosynthesis protein [Sphingopyxis alaskensis]|uniref:Surface carbohydrate biosynthesis protein n=1 Tax=Sphingopyxis alaskensis (strain DSM 13593 / LMG 18877 / RB2256) TaxID=317655 RepID=Q1GSU2_SPHAL|nr:surface carbohydrate biosynthesis protein [Sphingopyxis alaskensis]ABF53280.1 conserved hypothetical protein [Sphingopyxis alaskensis RB2256]